MSRLVLLLKGMCMGFTDVVPGVSGGTLALILGVYKELVETIRALSLRFVLLFFRYLKSRDDASKRAFLDEMNASNVMFLVTIVAGIGIAISIGSAVIPGLMENFPVQMRAFFCGLIIASVAVPLRMLGPGGARRPIVIGTVALGIVLGYLATDPRNTFETSREWFSVESTGESLKDVTRRGPSALSSAEVFWSPENEELREAVKRTAPEQYAALDTSHDAEGDVLGDKDTRKMRSAPYDELDVPAGTVVKVPRPTMWFVFLSGAVAICAMILPGVSGSYVLLVVGNYFFVLNALKGTISSLARGELPLPQGGYVLLFCLGCAVGIRLFSHVLTYLLRAKAAPTLGILTGLMVGCLRGVWPFREMVDGFVLNRAPIAADPIGVAVAAFIAGFVIVTVVSTVGRRKEAEAEG